MKNGKRIWSLFLTAALFLFFVSCGSGETNATTAAASSEETAVASGASTAAGGTAEFPQMTLKAGTVTTADSGYVRALEEMSKKLSELTGGAITLEVYPDGQLGGESDMIEGVAMGTLDICVTSSSPVCNYVPEFGTFDMPFLITDLDHAHEVMDGALGRGLLDKLSGVGIYGMALWDNGFRNLTNSKGPVYTVADVSGMKIRVMENEIHQALWTALGAYATPMAWGEVITALEQGTIDGEENPLNAIYTSGVYEVQKYITLTQHVYTAGVVMINQEKWDGFSDDVKAVFAEAMEYATGWERTYIDELENSMMDTLKEAGCEINEVNDKAEWIEAVSGLYEKYSGQVDKELLEALQGGA